MSVTHIAAPFVIIRGRVIQRCAVCGEKLVDTKGTAMPLRPDGTPDKMPTWGPFELVQVEGNRQSVIRCVDDKYPADGCIELVEG